MENIVAIFPIITFIVVFVAIVCSIYFGIRMYFEMTEKAKKYANWLPIIIPFMPSSYNDVGKKYLKKWLVSVWIVIIGMFVLFFSDFKKENVFESKNKKQMEIQSNNRIENALPKVGLGPQAAGRLSAIHAKR